MVPPLPQSVFARIIDCFDPVDVYGYVALRALTTVSKAFHSAAQPRLLSVVPVYSPQDKGLGELFAIVSLFVKQPAQPTKQTSKVGKASAEASKAKGAKVSAKAAKGIEWVDSEPEEDGIEEEGDGPAGKALDDRAKRLLNFFAKHPTLAAHATELDFFGVFEGGAAPRAIRRILALCPNIQSVKLVHHQFGEDYDERSRWPLLVLQTLAKERPRLRSLVIRGASFLNDNAVLQGISRMPALKSLEIEFLDDDSLDEWERPLWNRCQFDFKLERLILGTPATIDLFNDLTRTSRLTLRTLGIALLRDKYDLSAFTKLERVIIAACQYGVVVATLSSLPKSVTYLEVRESTAIGVLDGRTRRYESEDEWSEELDADEVEELDEYERDEYEERWEERRADKMQKEIDNSFSALLTSIPRHITHLRFPHYLAENEFEELVDTLAGSSFLPDLRILEVANPLKDHNFAEEELREGELEEMQKERQKLAAACEKRGVVLGPWAEDFEQVRNSEGKIPRAV